MRKLTLPPIFLCWGIKKDEESPMNGFLNGIKGISRFMYIISGIALTFIIGLTVSDVILRYFRNPILGTFELVAFTGGVVIGFAIPLTSWTRGHIFVDFFILKFPQQARNAINSVTRLMGIGLFFLVGWNLFKVGLDLQRSGEVSLTLQLPFYPVAFGIGVACFIQCLVLLCDILKIFGGKYE